MESIEGCKHIFTQSRLFLLLPEPTYKDFQDLWISISGSRRGSDPIEQSQRQHVFFDEVTSVYAVLQTAIPMNESIAEQLSCCLEVTLDASTIGSKKRTAQQAQALEGEVVSDHVLRWTNKDGPSPSIIFNGEDSKGFRSITAIYWTIDFHLDSAKIRSQHPSLYASATAKLISETAAESSTDEDEYLQSGVPVSQNPFRASTKGKTSASKISNDSSDILRADSGPPIRLIKAFRSKIRIFRTGGSTNIAKTFASVDFVASSFITDRVELDPPIAWLSNGVVSAVRGTWENDGSYECKPDDSISLVYKLARARRSETPSTLTITLNAYVMHAQRRIHVLKSFHKTIVDLPPPYTSMTSTNTQPNDLSNALTVTVSSTSKTNLNDTLRWTLSISNNHASDSVTLNIRPIVQSTRPNGPISSPSLIPLSPDLHVGPLKAESCVEHTMDFRVMKPGLVKPEALRIVEVSRGDENAGGSDRIVDLKGDCLPDVVAYDGDEDSEG